MCPICMSLLGPRPVYRKKGFFCSYLSRILSNSLMAMLGYHINSKQRHWPMTKKHSTSEKNVRSVASQSLESLQNLRIKPASAELDYELVVVNCILFSIWWYCSLDIPWCDNLFMPRRCCRCCIRFWGVCHRESAQITYLRNYDICRTKANKHAWETKQSPHCLPASFIFRLTTTQTSSSLTTNGSNSHSTP